MLTIYLAGIVPVACFYMARVTWLSKYGSLNFPPGYMAFGAIVSALIWPVYVVYSALLWIITKFFSKWFLNYLFKSDRGVVRHFFHWVYRGCEKWMK